MKVQIIHLHRQAPPKPAEGEPCNGCGVCCAAEPCPLAMLRFRQRHGACPALTWSDVSQRYHCGMMDWPATYFGLPQWLEPVAARLVARWIAAGKGCDSRV